MKSAFGWPERVEDLATSNMRRMISYIGQFQNCQNLEKAIRQNGNDSAQLKTPPISITAEMDLSGVELKFPIPDCKKATGVR